MKFELSVVKVYAFVGLPNEAPEYISEFRDSQLSFSPHFNTFFPTVCSLLRSQKMGIGIRHVRIEIPLI